MLVTVPTTIFTQEQKLPAALASLVQAEREVARYSVEHGTREAFLSFFSDEGVNFQPQPTKTREALLKRPAPTAYYDDGEWQIRDPALPRVW